MKDWFYVQSFDEYVDFDKEVLTCDDEGYTSLDVRLTFNTETRAAYMVLAWRNDNADPVDISGERGIDWSAALRLIEGDVPKHILEKLEALR